MSQVLDELGLQLTDQLSNLPDAGGAVPATSQKHHLPAAAVTGGGGGGSMSDIDADLQARLDNLRRE